jgi:hypothetical protein
MDKKLGYGQKQMPLPEREFYPGDQVLIYINKPDSIAPLTREGIYEGWSTWEGTIYLVLRNGDAYRLIPHSMLTRQSVARLGGVAPSATYELGNKQRKNK